MLGCVISFFLLTFCLGAFYTNRTLILDNLDLKTGYIMARHLNLVESDFELTEKRILPRFPFCYLTFKCSSQETRIFEIKDISTSGMQLGLKVGEHTLKDEDQIHGTIHWIGKELEISGDVKWNTNNRIGVEFSNKPSLRTSVDSFLATKNIADTLKPIHKLDYGVELPAKLKYWLRADGPVEIFVWQHSDGELSKFQVIIMENFLEWEDGKGLSTGRVMSKRDVDTPLLSEDEFVFKMDHGVDAEKVGAALELTSLLTEKQIPEELQKFFVRKLK